MSFTHYMHYHRARLTQGTWDKIRADVLSLLSNLPEHSKSAGGYYDYAPLKLVGFDQDPPIVDKNQIIINGTGADTSNGDSDPEALGHETFCLYRNWRAAVRKIIKNNPNDTWYKDQLEEKVHFECCKTACKPYDLVVCAILAVAEQHAPGWLKVTSNGERDDWRPAIEWASKVLGRKIDYPSGIKITIGEVDKAGAVQVGEGITV